MCGLTFWLNGDLQTDCLSPTVLDREVLEEVKRLLVRRGPDAQNALTLSLNNSDFGLYCTVLGLRGELTPQPVSSEHGHLAWNGEIFNIDLDANDTTWLSQRLEHENILTVLDSIQGPFAFVYVDERTQQVWFGRDKWGRRNLSYCATPEHGLVLSSIPCGPGWQEVPNQIFSLDLGTRHITQHSWPTPPLMSPWPASGSLEKPWEGLAAVLRESVRRRVVPGVGVLFSGGLDSTVLAALAAETTTGTIDLFNVAFGLPAPDRYTAYESLRDLRAVYGDRFRLVVVDVSTEELAAERRHILTLLEPKNSHMDFNIGAALWFAARGQGTVVTEIPDLDAPPAVTAVKKVGPKTKVKEKSVDCQYCGLTSKAGCVHRGCKLCCRLLRQRSQGTSWDGPNESARIRQLKEVQNVESFCSTHSEKEKTVEDAKETNVEDSKDQQNQPTPAEVYRTKAKVLLVGVGADELLGGYARYFTKLVHGGLEGLRDEMLLDLGRLWSRNLGRDDKMIADHGREARHPFLDENVVDFITKIPMPILAAANGECDDFGVTPDKWLLRVVAKQLGLPACSAFKKRAIQFGTRIAKNTNLEMHGSNRKGRGTMQFVPETP